MTWGNAADVDDINTQSAMVGGSFGDDATWCRRGQSRTHQPSGFPKPSVTPLTRCSCGRFRAFQEHADPLDGEDFFRQEYRESEKPRARTELAAHELKMTGHQG